MPLNPLKRPDNFFGLVLALELGSFVRLLPVATNAFPLNDGGMFYRMTEELAANGFHLPIMTSYNGGGIPFAYPPLGFYLAAGLHQVTNAPILELVRWLPALFSILTILPLYFLARRILPSSNMATIAVLTFALIPRSHEWTLMGGGLARSPGMLFSTLSLLQALRLLERPTWKNAFLLGLLFALVTVFHLEMAWFTLFSLVLFWLFRGKTRNSLGGVVMALAVAAALSSLWWLPVLANHGLAPFVQAVRTGQHNWSSSAAILTEFTGEPYVGVFALLGLLGGVLCIVRRDFLLPAWLLLTVLLDPRAAGTDGVAPMAMLVALAFTDIILPPLIEPGVHPALVEGKPGSRLSGVQPTLGRPRTLAVAALVAYGVYAALMAQYVPWSSFAVLRPGEVEALDWIDNAVPVSGEFLVISGRTAWGSDPLSEWFPALTHHVSLATPQGKEWTGGLADATARHRTLQLCSQLGLACLEEWVTEGDTHFDFVLVAKYPASSAIQTVALIEGIGRSQEYEMVYTNPDAAVFSHRFTQTP